MILWMPGLLLIFLVSECCSTMLLAREIEDFVLCQRLESMALEALAGLNVYREVANMKRVAAVHYHR